MKSKDYVKKVWNKRNICPSLTSFLEKASGSKIEKLRLEAQQGNLYRWSLPGIRDISWTSWASREANTLFKALRWPLYEVFGEDLIAVASEEGTLNILVKGEETLFRKVKMNKKLQLNRVVGKPPVPYYVLVSYPKDNEK